LGNRELLARADIDLFLENPFLGVGPGMGIYQRRNVVYAAAHTEYTRILSEHGSGGVLALLVLAIVLSNRYFKAPDALTRAWVVALAAWPLVEMAHAAMRVAGIALMLGMATVIWKPEDEPQPQKRKHPLQSAKL
jgi:hypothetical protein